MPLDNLRQDLRFAIRSYAKAPSFTLAILATLSLGIGASTAIFSMVNGILLRPLPLPDADRLVYANELGREGSQISVSWPNFLDWRTRTHALESLALSRDEPLTLTGLERPEREHRRRARHQDQVPEVPRPPAQRHAAGGRSPDPPQPLAAARQVLARAGPQEPRVRLVP